jgi:hypothetical protein
VEVAMLAASVLMHDETRPGRGHGGDERHQGGRGEAPPWSPSLSHPRSHLTHSEADTNSDPRLDLGNPIARLRAYQGQERVPVADIDHKGCCRPRRTGASASRSAGCKTRCGGAKRESRGLAEPYGRRRPSRCG